MSKTITIELGTLTSAQAEDITALITGAFLPWLIAAINQGHWSKKARIAVALAVSGVVATLETLYIHGYSPANAASLGLKLFFAATLSYRAIGKNLGIQKFEQATTALVDKAGERAASDE